MMTRWAAYFCFATALISLLGILAEPELMAGGIIAGAFWGWAGAMALSISRGLRPEPLPPAGNGSGDFEP